MYNYMVGGGVIPYPVKTIGVQETEEGLVKGEGQRFVGHYLKNSVI